MQESLPTHRITMTRALATSFSHIAQSVSSYNVRSGSPLKRKRPNGDASNYDPNDEDYINKSVSTGSCVSILLFTSRIYTETSPMMHAHYGVVGYWEAVLDRFI